VMGVTDKRTSPSLPVFHNITWVLKFIIIWEASIFELTPSSSLKETGAEYRVSSNITHLAYTENS